MKHVERIFERIEDRKHFSIAEVATAFDVTVQAVHQWIRTGRIRRAERISKKGYYQIPRAEFVRLLKLARRPVEGVWEPR